MRPMTPFHREALAAELRDAAAELGFAGLLEMMEPQERNDGRLRAPDRNPERTR